MCDLGVNEVPLDASQRMRAPLSGPSYCGRALATRSEYAFAPQHTPTLDLGA